MATLISRLTVVALIAALASAPSAGAFDAPHLSAREAHRAVKQTVAQQFTTLARVGQPLRVGVGRCQVRGTRGTCAARTRGTQRCRMRAHVREVSDGYWVWVDQIRCG